MAGCCATSQVARHQLAEVLDEAVDDPALQACCARDLREQAYSGWLKAELLARDQSNTKLEIAAAAIRPSSDANLLQNVQDFNDLDCKKDCEGDCAAAQ